DNASPELAAIRSQLKIAHDRLISRLERILNDPKQSGMLQEPLVTQRGGRYVVPLRSEFKGQLRAIIHDQSSSGATYFVEPLAVVELNNQYHELQLAERDEVRRVLAALSALVGQAAEAILQNVEGLADFDLALTCAKYGEELRASEPQLLPIPSKDGLVVRLYQARHPLLPAESVVPVDVHLDSQVFGLVITGPNTGGKTVTLKTTGLLALMAQSGLHIPAQSGSALSFFSDIYADIGDEQSIEQSLSTFSGHITNIIRVFKKATPDTLVLLDELGAGTDPQEGAALARALLAHLVEKNIPCLVATHYPELKTYAHATPGVVNASMEFDLRSLRPTYRLTIGLPGRSNALLIAERLGLPKDILEAARSSIDPSDLRAEDLLDEIHHQRDLALRATAAAEQAREEADRTRRELRTRLENIEEERAQMLEAARSEAKAEIAELRQEMDATRKALSRAHQPLEALKPLQQQVETLETLARAPVIRHNDANEADERHPVGIGQKVRVRSLDLEGVITAISETEVEVQAGALRLRARLADVARAGGGDAPAAPQEPKKGRSKGKTTASAPAAPGMELDLRGQRADEALEALERYIDSAYLSGMPFVRIIHGKGTGKLRQAVRDALRHSSHVARWETGLDSEGGEGVTVAHLRGE
ncbi:MAG: endonuclease MutS2, partial [Anaerolineae bacterium]|nr:endonuclease MutS2 [Anaerolineae bacterium]